MAPVFPTEAVGGMTPLSPELRRRAQATLRAAVPNLDQPAWGIHMFTAAVLSLSGATHASTLPLAFTRAQVLSGLKRYLAAWMGGNQLSRQQLTTESFGLARAVSEMLLGAGLLHPATPAPPAPPPPPTVSVTGLPPRETGQRNGREQRPPVVGARWYARLFPVWGAEDPAAFHGLLAKGGCAYTASWADGVVQSPVTVDLSFPAWPERQEIRPGVANHSRHATRLRSSGHLTRLRYGSPEQQKIRPAVANLTGCALLNPWPSATAARVQVVCNDLVGAHTEPWWSGGDGGGSTSKTNRKKIAVSLTWHRMEDGDVLSWDSLPIGTRCEVSLN